MAVPVSLTPRTTSTAALRTTFGVWGIAFALGVLFHEWQTGQPPWSIHGLAAAAALGVLLSPTTVWRTVLLMAVLAAELAVDLPNPWNHTVVAGMIGSGLVAWWLVLAVRRPELARDAGHVLREIAPFLRVAFIATWYLAAFAKLNTGFLDTSLTCAMWILDAVPLLSVPEPLRGAVIIGTLVVELSIPTMLLLRRTRALAVVVGFGFHLVSALAGHTAFSGLAWSFYLLFLPVTTVAGAATLVRRRLGPDRRRQIATVAASPLAWILAAACWASALGALHLLPDMMTMNRFKRWVPAFGYLAWMALWVGLLWQLRRTWVSLRPSRAGLRVRQPVFLVVLGLVLVSAACPYLGLKTKYAFTMYSNLHTEPGRWNHLVVPESVRVFGAQDGSVRFMDISDPALAAAVAGNGGERVVLLDARRLATAHPDAVVTYELDGAVRTAAPIGADPVLGEPVPGVISWLGGFKQLPSTDSCQH